MFSLRPHPPHLDYYLQVREWEELVCRQRRPPLTSALAATDRLAARRRGEGAIKCCREFVKLIYLFTSDPPSRYEERVMSAADLTVTPRHPSTPADSLRAPHSRHAF